MKIVIAGGTGFLGRPLAKALVADGHSLVILTRGATTVGAGPVRHVTWSPTGGIGPWTREIDGAELVVNLAGEPIAAKRWSADQKRRILDSRVLATRSVVRAIAEASTPPSLLINGSAVGYYGPRGDELVSEDTPAGTDFLAQVCAQWEAAALGAATARTRVVSIRTGLVIEKDGGALKKMLPPFQLGAGGPVGSGQQYWPWIHRRDWIDLIRWVIRTPSVTGPLNATAPNPVTSAAFASALGHALHRPAFIPAPAFMLRLILGEMADALLLSGQRAVPAKAQGLWFTFQYAQLHDALAAIFGK